MASDDTIPTLRHIQQIDDETGRTNYVAIRPRRPGRECQDCEAFVLWQEIDPGFGKRDGLSGHCRRRSPSGHSPGFHPEVSATHWCLGFWKRGAVLLALDAVATMRKDPQP